MDVDAFSANEFLSVLRVLRTLPEESPARRGASGGESAPPPFVSCEICAELLETAG